MGRVDEKNIRYRTKAEIVNDVAFILNAPVKQGTKWAVLRDAAWVWTEFYGKYDGCPNWTVMAQMQKLAYPEAKFRHFRHEHAVPKSVVIKMLLELPSPTPEQVQSICESFLVGVVVTLEENDLLNDEWGRKMPPEFYDAASPHYHDPWLRYRMCNIKLGCQK